MMVRVREGREGRGTREGGRDTVGARVCANRVECGNGPCKESLPMIWNLVLEQLKSIILQRERLKPQQPNSTNTCTMSDSKADDAAPPAVVTRDGPKPRLTTKPQAGRRPTIYTLKPKKEWAPDLQAVRGGVPAVPAAAPLPGVRPVRLRQVLAHEDELL